MTKLKPVGSAKEPGSEHRAMQNQTEGVLSGRPVQSQNQNTRSVSKVVMFAGAAFLAASAVCAARQGVNFFSFGQQAHFPDGRDGLDSLGVLSFASDHPQCGIDPAAAEMLSVSPYCGPTLRSPEWHLHIDGKEYSQGTRISKDRIETGAFVKKMAKGHGRITWTNHSYKKSYVGNLVHGNPHGKGKSVYQDGVYEGDHAYGLFHGQGRYSFNDGRIFVGSYARNQPNGRGKHTDAKTGYSYEGDVVDGKHTGQGVASWADGRRYKGGFLNGERHGKGTYTSGAETGYTYEGDVVDGKHTGQGVESWADGRRYKGGFLNGNRHGIGTYTSADGLIHEGQWENGLKHGPGKSMKKNGEDIIIISEGIWEKGVQDTTALLPQDKTTSLWDKIFGS